MMPEQFISCTNERLNEYEKDAGDNAKLKWLLHYNLFVDADICSYIIDQILDIPGKMNIIGVQGTLKSTNFFQNPFKD